jgi:hypothetical protein
MDASSQLATVRASGFLSGRRSFCLVAKVLPMRKLNCVSIGSDLLLLAVERKHGRVRSRPKLGVALAAADLVEFVLAGHVALNGDRLSVVDTGATAGHAAAELRTVADAASPVTAAHWISGRASSAFGAHLRDAKQSGVLAEAPRRRNERFTPLAVLDRARVQGAERRFVMAARAAEPAADDTGRLADFAYAMLADGVGLTDVYLGGLSNRKARARLEASADQRGDGREPEHSIRVIVRIARRKIERTPDRPGDGPVPTSSSQFGGLPPGGALY